MAEQFTGFTRNLASQILASNINDNCYVCIFNTPPNANGDGFSEPSTQNGYQRHSFGAVDTSIKGQVANADIIFLFESINAGCGSAEYVGLAKKEDVGVADVFLVAQLVAPISMDAGTVPLIRKHAFIIGLDKEDLEAYPT